MGIEGTPGQKQSEGGTEYAECTRCGRKVSTWTVAGSVTGLCADCIKKEKEEAKNK